MALPTYMIVTLANLMFCWIGCGSGLRVVIQPQPFTSSTKELKISCIVDEPAHLATSILNIKMMRHIEDKYIASINMRKELKMGVGVKENVKAEGHIGKKSYTSYLNLIIDKPDREDAGLYRCQMFFTDENFQVVEKNVLGNVTYQVYLGPEWKFYKGDRTFIRVFGKDDAGKRLSWDKARQACQTFSGGDLVQIHDDAKNTFVYNMAKTGIRNLYAHIGIKNGRTGHYDFSYVDGSALGSFHPWWYNEPDGNISNDHRCVMMSIGTGAARQWADSNCPTPRPYVCSVPA